MQKRYLVGGFLVSISAGWMMGYATARHNYVEFGVSVLVAGAAWLILLFGHDQDFLRRRMDS